MARRNHRPPRRNATRAPQSRVDRATKPRIEDEPIIQGLREALRTDEGVGLLDAVGTLLETVAAAPRMFSSPVTLPQFVEMFIAIDVAETTAALHVMAAFLDDDELIEQIRRELADRRQPIPAVVRNLASATVTEAWTLSDEFGDVEDILLGLDGLRPAETAVLQLLHEDVGAVTDGFLADSPLAEVRTHFEQHAAGEGTIQRLSLADARARLESTLDDPPEMPMPPGETWPGGRPLVRYLIRGLPDGGAGYRREPLSEAEVAQIRDDILGDHTAGAEGLDTTPGSADARLVEALVEFAGSSGLCEPWRWSPSRVDTLFMLAAAWEPRVGPGLADLPRVLRAVVTVAARRRGVSPVGLSRTSAAIEHSTPEFHRAIGHVRHPAARLTDLFVPSGRRASLAAYVGGQAQLDALDQETVEPLIDQPLDLASLPAAARERAAAAEALAVEAIEHLTDPSVHAEFRAGVRTFLRRLAQRAPDTVRRGKPNVTAAALCWAVGRANDLVGEQPKLAQLMTQLRTGSKEPLPPAVRVKDLTAHLGADANVTTRATRLLEAAGYTPSRPWQDTFAVGDPDLLTAATRRRIALERNLTPLEYEWDDDDWGDEEE